MFFQGIQFLSRGGPTMWPLMASAIVSLAVIFERFLYLKRAASQTEVWLPHIQQLLSEARDDEALKIVSTQTGPAAAMVAEAIRNRDLPVDQLEKRLEEMAMKEMPKLSKRLNSLDTIITISPLLGLLGTVTGMIAAFHVVGDPNAGGGPAAITGDVAEALIATATGLAIAIVTLVGYNWLGERVKEVIASMELSGTQVVNHYSIRAIQFSASTNEAAKARA